MRTARQMRLQLLLAICVALVLVAQQARADDQLHLEQRAEGLRRTLLKRGEPAGEISLGLAWLYAKANRIQEAVRYVQHARKQGIEAGRIDLLLGNLYRRQGRYDAAFSTLVRVLVRHPEQPYALVQLWKTLYESKLQGAQVKTDTDVVRERLANLGFYFPAVFRAKKLSLNESKELAAAAYNALLTGKTRFAAELFEAALDVFPSNPLAHRGLGIARARLHDFVRASGAYLLYLELKPDAPDADEVDRVLMEYWRTRSTSKE